MTEEKFVSRFGDVSLDDHGWANMPGWLLRNMPLFVNVGTSHQDQNKLSDNSISHNENFGKVVGIKSEHQTLLTHIISFHYDCAGGQSAPDMGRLAVRCGRSRETVRRWKAELVEIGALDVTYRTNNTNIFDFSELVRQSKLFEELRRASGMGEVEFYESVLDGTFDGWIQTYIIDRENEDAHLKFVEQNVPKNGGVHKSVERGVHKSVEHKYITTNKENIDNTNVLSSRRIDPSTDIQLDDAVSQDDNVTEETVDKNKSQKMGGRRMPKMDKDKPIVNSETKKAKDSLINMLLDHGIRELLKIDELGEELYQTKRDRSNPTVKPYTATAKQLRRIIEEYLALDDRTLEDFFDDNAAHIRDIIRGCWNFMMNERELPHNTTAHAIQRYLMRYLRNKYDEQFARATGKTYAGMPIIERKPKQKTD